MHIAKLLRFYREIVLNYRFKETVAHKQVSFQGYKKGGKCKNINNIKQNMNNPF